MVRPPSSKLTALRYYFGRLQTPGGSPDGTSTPVVGLPLFCRTRSDAAQGTQVKPQQARPHQRTPNAAKPWRPVSVRLAKRTRWRYLASTACGCCRFPFDGKSKHGTPKRKANMTTSSNTASRPRRRTPTAAGSEGGWYDQRVLVQIPYPVACPKCGSRDTRMNGLHYNKRTATRLENRICCACHFTFTGARGMTPEERKRRGMA